MKLVKGQQIKDAWGTIWVYQGLTDSAGFECDRCGKLRQHLHEFLGYTNLETANTNPMGFKYHLFYGTECVRQTLLIKEGERL